jgi:quercetin dioxygenase-like cupin family protein
VTGQVIHHDGRGTIAELAFSSAAVMAPHTNSNTTYFVVVSGGGFVQVADERARVGHGEAVLWPAGEFHGAWTDGTEMRALIVEFSGSDDAAALAVEAATVPPSSPPSGASGDAAPVERGRGSLAEPTPPAPADRDESSGEPW